MAEHFTTSTATGIAVMLTTVGIYLAFVLLVRLVGQRTLASMSSFDFACVVALGAVLGRSVLLEDPNLATGVIALATFFVVRAALARLTRSPRVGRAVNRPAVLLMAGNRLMHQNMHRVHVSEDEVRQALRRAGIRSRDQVQCVVLERNGAVSVIEGERPVDGWLLADVAGAEALSDSADR